MEPVIGFMVPGVEVMVQNPCSTVGSRVRDYVPRVSRAQGMWLTCARLV
jgi:hypothetical protein